MHKSMMIAAALALSAGVASAKARIHPPHPAPTIPPSIPTAATMDRPVAGANSFTEGQAKSRIESGGYSGISSLKKDDNGVWRGKAMKDGKSVDVSLDFQGNVIAR